MSVVATQTIRKMRGGSQSLLMLGSDKYLWVVKFQNNPQHIRVLSNEFIGAALASAIGLSVPAFDTVDVAPWLTEGAWQYDLGMGRVEKYAGGLHFGSRLVGGLSGWSINCCGGARG